jgi:ligand-binding sensor domain-containing protein
MKPLSRHGRTAVWIFAFLLFVSITAVLAYLLTTYPILRRAPSPATAVRWSSLPTPTIAHPQWSSYTNPQHVRALLPHAGLLWFATNGGLVVQDAAGNSAKFTSEHGLAENDATTLTLDSNGALWIGTAHGGISRYDGTNWQTFTTANGLPSNTIRRLTPTSNGMIWAATDQGIAQYDGRRWYSYNIPRSFFQLPSNNIRAVAAVPNTPTLWAATDQGAAFYNGRRWESIPHIGSQFVNDLHDIAITPDGQVWAATSGGLTRYDGARWYIYTTADGLLANEIAALTAQPDNSLWLGYQTTPGLTQFNLSGNVPATTHIIPDDGLPDTPVHTSLLLGNTLYAAAANGLYARQDGRWQPIPLPTDIPHMGTAVSGLVSTPGQISLSTNQGIAQFQNGAWQSSGSGNGLPTNEIVALTRDTAGQLWAAFPSSRYGAARYNTAANQWETRACISNAPPSANVRAAIQTADGRLWFATDQGISQLDGDQWRTITTADGLPANNIYALAAAPNGMVWAATNAGLAHLANGRWQTIHPGPVQNVVVGSDARIWFFDETGISRWDGATAIAISTPPVSWVYDALARADGLWLATEEGIWRYDDGRWQSWSADNNLPATRTRVLAESADGALWVGQESAQINVGNGRTGQTMLHLNYLLRYDGAQWTAYPLTNPSGLLHPLVTAIQPAPDGAVWLGTLGGLTRLTGAQTTRHTTPFTTIHGLPDNQIWSLAWALDTLWVVTNQGLARYTPDAAQPFTPLPETADLWPTPAEIQLHVGPDGRLWAIGGSVLAEYTDAAWRIIPLTPPHPAMRLRTLTFDATGQLWLAADAPDLPANERHFLARWDGATADWLPLQPQAADPFVSVTQMAFTDDGVLWLANSNGLWRLANPLQTPRQPMRQPDSLGISALLPRADGLWFTQEVGSALTHWDTGTVTNITPLANMRGVQTAVPDDQGGLWLGTDRGAIYVAADGSWWPFELPDEQINLTLTTMAEADDGALWLGTFSGQVQRWADGQVTEYARQQLPRQLLPRQQSPVSGLLPQADGSVWWTNFGDGVSQLANGRWQNFVADQALANTAVHALAVDTAGQVWLGTEDGLLTVTQVDGETVCTFVPEGADITAEVLTAAPDGLLWAVAGSTLWQQDVVVGFRRQGSLMQPVMTIAPDGAVWAVSQDGLLRWANGQRQTIVLPPEVAVTALAVGPDNGVWLGTADAGLARLVGNEWVWLTAVDGLAGNSITHMAVESDGTIWLVTNGGVSRLRP